LWYIELALSAIKIGNDTRNGPLPLSSQNPAITPFVYVNGKKKEGIFLVQKAAILYRTIAAIESAIPTISSQLKHHIKRISDLIRGYVFHHCVTWKDRGMTFKDSWMDVDMGSVLTQAHCYIAFGDFTQTRILWLNLPQDLWEIRCKQKKEKKTNLSKAYAHTHNNNLLCKNAHFDFWNLHFYVTLQLFCFFLQCEFVITKPLCFVLFFFFLLNLQKIYSFWYHHTGNDLDKTRDSSEWSMGLPIGITSLDGTWIHMFVVASYFGLRARSSFSSGSFSSLFVGVCSVSESGGLSSVFLESKVHG